MLGTNRKGSDQYTPYSFWPAQQEWLRRYFVFEPATYGLEGLANLLKTMVDNGLSALIRVFVKTGVVVVLDGIRC